MKIVRLETDRIEDGCTLTFNNDDGIVPEFPNTINEFGEDIGVGKISKDAWFYHSIVRGETRYLIYLNGSVGRLNGNEVFDLEKSLDSFLIFKSI